MNRYEVFWSAFGSAIVQADSAKDAEKLVSNGCMSWRGDIDWEDGMVDGCQAIDAEVVEG